MAGVALDEVVTIEEDMIGVGMVLLEEVDTVEASEAEPGVMRHIRATTVLSTTALCGRVLVLRDLKNHQEEVVGII